LVVDGLGRVGLGMLGRVRTGSLLNGEEDIGDGCRGLRCMMCGF
jgi:hypothetical protein